jgi:signal transduction histidine kinase
MVSFNSADVLSRVNGRRGLGLLSMKKERNYWGRISINSQPDTGTQISIEIPINLERVSWIRPRR